MNDKMINSQNDINIYCDESCHIISDGNDIAVFGGISLEKSKIREINKRIRIIKKKYNVYEHAELKWVKVSQSKVEMYKELIDLFFDYDDIFFRAVIVNNKKAINLKKFNFSYDDLYYRMYFLLLKEMIYVDYKYSVYLDIKDNKGHEKIEKLKKVLNHTLFDFYDSTIKDIQLLRSDQIEIMGLVDILIGAISYKNRKLTSSKGKLEIIKYIENKRKINLNISSKRGENKFNIFIWEPRNV